MDKAQIDTNDYNFWEEDPEYVYQHKYLVPGTETDKFGMDEKWSQWTNKTAREFSIEKNVYIVQTRKNLSKPA